MIKIMNVKKNIVQRMKVKMNLIQMIEHQMKMKIKKI